MLAPLASSTPITWKGMFLMRIVLPSGLVVWKSFSTIVWPITHTLAAGVTSRSVKKPPWRSLPVADRQVRRAHAGHLVGAPVRVAVDDLARGAHDGRGGQDGGALAGDGVGVGGGERGLVPAPWRTPPAVAAAGEDDDHVRAQALELPLHQAAGALADRDHRGHRGDADDDAQHGQAGPHLVLAQGPQGDAKSQQQVHAASLRSMGDDSTSGDQLLRLLERAGDQLRVRAVAQAGGRSRRPRSKSPSTTHTCRRLRLRPGLGPFGGAIAATRVDLLRRPGRRRLGVVAFQQLAVLGADLFRLGVEPQGRVGNLQHAACVSAIWNERLAVMPGSSFSSGLGASTTTV